MARLCLILALVATASSVSPVMKVVELLDECKAKVANDLAAESKAMETYTAFCDDELKDKAYAIETAGSKLNDLSAVVEDSRATIAEMEDESTTLGTVMAGKEKELYTATTERAASHDDFVAAEKEMVASIDQLTRAYTLIKKEMSFAQGRGINLAAKLSPMTSALSKIIDAQWVSTGSRRTLKSFIQSANAAKAAADEDDDLSLTQPQAKQVAYESSSGGILTALEEMQGKAQDTLSDLRKKEMQAQHSSEMVKSGLENEIKHTKESHASATSSKAAATEALASAQAESVETSNAKAADEAYAGTLKTECETKAAEWAERSKSAGDEMAVIDKAKEILVSGVKAFVQVSTTSSKKSDDDSDDDKSSEIRERLAGLLKDLASKHHSFALTQMASMARSDPFVKIRGLIEDMISKLIKEANEEATHEAFCQEEMGKSKKSQEEKSTKVDQYQVRMDKATSTIAILTEDVKELESEVANIDSSNAAATQQRATEHADYVKASTDFRASAQAVAKALEVLKSYYEGALLQLASKSQKAGPDFGSAKGDSAHTIIAVLEMSEEDFTRLLAESEATEDEAANAFAKLSDENKLAKATKQTEAKGKQSEVKSLTVQLEHSKEDHASVSKELDAVLSYLEKLRPECESKAMSYAEKKAAREAEIDGLKEALTILSGDGMALVQKQRYLRTARRV